MTQGEMSSQRRTLCRVRGGCVIIEEIIDTADHAVYMILRRKWDNECMEQSRLTEEAQSLSITLEIVPEDVQDPDPAAISAAGRSIVSYLEREGYPVKPVYTGQRGGIELLFQVILQATQTVGADVWAQKDSIDLLSALCTIFATVSPLVLHVFRSHEKQPADRQPKVTIHIDKTGIDVTSSDVADDERIVQLAQRFLAMYPSSRVTPHSKVKVQERIPKRHRHRRR
jgi:hypothetical protein